LIQRNSFRFWVDRILQDIYGCACKKETSSKTHVTFPGH